jgi:hypothetical protein
MMLIIFDANRAKKRHYEAGRMPIFLRRILSEFLLQLYGDREPGKPVSKNEYPFVWCILHG